MKIIQLHKKEYSQGTINLLKKQNSDAQEMVYAKYAPKMLGVCRQYIQDMQNAEEIMLHGFFKVFTKIDKFKSKGSFEGWIRKIMVNECISFLRLKKRFIFVEDDSFFIEEQSEEIEIADEKVSTLQLLVDNLREDLRVVFNLYVVEEYKHREIAVMLNITENASKLRYRKAKLILQENYNNIKKSL